jgi:hypothetical protein
MRMWSLALSTQARTKICVSFDCLQDTVMALQLIIHL